MLNISIWRAGVFLYIVLTLSYFTLIALCAIGGSPDGSLKRFCLFKGVIVFPAMTQTPLCFYRLLGRTAPSRWGVPLLHLPA